MARSLQGRFTFKRVQILHAEFLGSGAYGTVCRAKCDELPCAAKLLHSQLAAAPLVMDKFRQECEFFASISHPNIVQFLGVHQDPKTGQPALLMELMDENLTKFLARQPTHVPLHTQVDICHDVTLALHYLLLNDIIYRDLSSNNVLLVAGRRAKITDLGVAKLKESLQGQQQQLTICPGSPPYMPPEALEKPPRYSEKLDVFSFGVLFLQIVTRVFPHPDQHEIQVADAGSPKGYITMPVSEADRRQQDIQLIPRDHPLQDMILKCLEDLPDNRPPLDQLCNQLERAKEYNWYLDSVKKVNTTYQASTVASESQNATTADLQAEIHRLQQELAQCQKTIKQKDEELQEIKFQAQNQPHNPERSLQIDDAVLEAVEGKKIIRGLTPQLVCLLSKNQLGDLPGVSYNDPEEGAVSVKTVSSENLDTCISRLLNNYKHVANQSQQLDLYTVPPNYPVSDVKALISSYNKRYQKLCLSYVHVSDVQAIQVVSISPEEFAKVKEELESELSLTIYVPDGHKLHLRRGNLIKQSAQILVSPSNRNLLMQGGVAGAINTASRRTVQQRADDYVNQNGALREGQVAVTEAGGDLECKWIIHAVGPQCVGNRHTPNSSQRVLREAVKNSLTCAETLNATSIAFPPISTGHFNMDSKLAANAIINSILDYDFKSNAFLREICIVIIDQQTFSVFREVFQERKKEIMMSAGALLELNTSPPRNTGCLQQ